MALIDRLRRRPTAEHVVHAHGADVTRLLRRIFGPGADVDDVFQAVFVEIIRSLPAFRGNSQLKTWIHRITLNVAYQEMRFRYRERAVRSAEDAETLMEAWTNDTDDFARSDALHMLYEGLEQLDPKKRIALVLHDIEGYTLKETGELLGRPLQTVASQVKSGRSQLANWYAAQEAPRGVHSAKGVS